MATATWDQAAAQLKLNVKCLMDYYADLPTLVTDIGTAEESVKGDAMPVGTVGTLATFRNRLARATGRDLHRRLWASWLTEVCRTKGYPERTFDAMCVRIHRDMHTNSKTFNDRGRTIPTTGTAGGSNVGNGTASVLKEDWEGYTLQGGHVETKTIECVEDQNLGRLKNAEVFEARGTDRSKDLLDYSGSGMRSRLYSMHAGSGASGSVLQNSSFDSAFSGDGTDKIPGWTIGGTAADVTYNTTAANIYRDVPGASTSAALAFAAAAGTNQVTQALSLRRINAMGERVPWMLQVAYRMSAVAAASGTMRIKMGNQTQTLDLATVADTNKHILQMPFNKNLYYRNWKEDAPDIEVEFDALSGATAYIDDLIFAPMTRVDGLWWWLVGGPTAFLQRDVFTHATTGGAAADCEMMFSAWWAGLPWFMFPTNSAGTETITDP